MQPFVFFGTVRSRDDRPWGIEAKLFGLGFGLVASGLGLMKIGLAASKMYSMYSIN